MKRFWFRASVCFPAVLSAAFLVAIFINCGMAWAIVLPIIGMALFLPWAYRTIDERLAREKRERTARHIQEKASAVKPEETHYLMESADGSLVRVPADKLESWEAAQVSAELTEAEKKLRDAILHDLYGKRHSSYKGGENRD